MRTRTSKKRRQTQRSSRSLGMGTASRNRLTTRALYDTEEVSTIYACGVTETKMLALCTQIICFASVSVTPRDRFSVIT